MKTIAIFLILFSLAGLLVLKTKLVRRREVRWRRRNIFPLPELPALVQSNQPMINDNLPPEIETPVFNEIDFIFDNFVGNESAILILKRYLKFNKINGGRLPNIAFFGAKSTGKTELARRVAKSLGLPVLHLTKSILSSEKEFFDELQTKSYNGTAIPMVVFIDEVHSLSRKIQDELLTSLENDDRVFRSKYGNIDTNNVTFVVATTDPGKLSEAFISRFLVINLKPYSVDEVVEILKMRMQTNKFHPLVQLLDDEVLQLIVRISRCVPRQALQALRQVGISLSLEEVSVNYSSVAEDLMKLYCCDELGFTDTDRAYMDFLSREGVTGIGGVSAFLGRDVLTIENVIEPWLIQSGMVSRTSRGRKLTEKGQEYLNEYRLYSGIS